MLAVDFHDNVIFKLAAAQTSNSSSQRTVLPLSFTVMSTPADFWFYNSRFAGIPTALCSATREKCDRGVCDAVCRARFWSGGDPPHGAGTDPSGLVSHTGPWGHGWGRGSGSATVWGAGGKETRVSQCCPVPAPGNASCGGIQGLFKERVLLQPHWVVRASVRAGSGRSAG